VDNKDRATWNGFFSALVGWSMHPGYYRDNATKPSLEDCAKIADEMLLISKAREL
jgi:hypothetical protein